MSGVSEKREATGYNAAYHLCDHIGRYERERYNQAAAAGVSEVVAVIVVAVVIVSVMVMVVVVIVPVVIVPVVIVPVVIVMVVSFV